MKRGRKSATELAQLAKRPADLREPWQIEQAARCGCKGADDLCPCQNENPWPRPFVDWKARAETAEAQLADVRDTMITAMNNRDEWMELAHKTNAQFAEAKGEVERLREELESDLDGPGLRELSRLDQATITALTAQRDRLLEALESIAQPSYGLGFNKLRGIARAALIKFYGGKAQYDARARKAHDGVEGEG